MKTILATNAYRGAVLELVQSYVPKGFRLQTLPECSTDALISCAADADYILASGGVKLTKEVLDQAKKLKMVQRTGVGLDALDLEALKSRNIPLYVNQGVNAESAAEHTLLLMLACLRRLPIVHQNTRTGNWKKQEQGIQTYELAGKTVGLVGMGNIARAVVRLLKGFGVRILYYDPCRLGADEEAELGITYCAYADLLPRADILSLHCPLTDQTRRLVNAASLAELKDGAVLINTARGGLVDTEALVKALKTGKLAFVGLDVYEEEPLKSTSELTQLENVILTSHIGGITRDSFCRMMHAAMRNIEQYENGELAEIARYLH